MKKSLLVLTCLLSFQTAFAKNSLGPVADAPISINAADLELHEPLEKVKVNEIKGLVQDLGSEATCLDEYLQRRKQLLIKFAVTPVVLTASAAAAVVVGGYAGVGIAAATGQGAHGWTALGYFIGGAMIGSASTVLVVTADTTASGINYYDNDLMMKALGEYYLEREGEKMNKLYSKVTKKMTDKPSYEEFVDKLVSMDQSGELCDGSLVKQPLVKLGFKLKYKLARPKNLRTIF